MRLVPPPRGPVPPPDVGGRLPLSAASRSPPHPGQAAGAAGAIAGIENRHGAPRRLPCQTRSANPPAIVASCVAIATSSPADGSTPIRQATARKVPCTAHRCPGDHPATRGGRVAGTRLVGRCGCRTRMEPRPSDRLALARDPVRLVARRLPAIAIRSDWPHLAGRRTADGGQGTNTPPSFARRLTS